MASLRSELVWRRTSPKSGSVEGPVLYQLIFRSSATPGNVPAIANNFTLTNSPIAVTGSGIQVSGDVQTSGHFIGDGSQLTNLPGGAGGTVTSVGLSAAVSDFVVTGSPISNSGTLNLNWNIAPTSSNMPNSIVKRDAYGTISVGTLSAQKLFGDGSGLINLPTGITSVGLATPSDFLVSGSPLTSNGTLSFSWSIPPTNSNVANAIVKRDNLGNINAGTITALNGIVGNGIGVATGVSGTGGNNSGLGANFSGGAPNGSAVFASGAGTGAGGVFLGGDSNGPGIVSQGGGSTGLAGRFTGNVQITGNLTATGTKNFKIDHPLAPAKKYLVHAAIESSEVMNLYSGNVTLNRRGEAWVELPDWFEALNQDFRYVLTAIGAPGPNLYVAREIRDHRFKIAGGKPLAKVSWQVTGVRHDAYMAAHPMQIEEDKPADERGHYLHPELFGQPEEKTVGRIARPEEK